MDMSKVTEEQMAKARECKSPEELLELAKAEGVELSVEDLEDVSGGGWGPEDQKHYYCRQCNVQCRWGGVVDKYYCPQCGRKGMAPEDMDWK